MPGYLHWDSSANLQSILSLPCGKTLFSIQTGFGSDPTGQSEPLPWEFPLILILTPDINAGHQTQMPTNPALSSFSTEKTAGLFSQLRSPAVPPVCQVTQRLPPSHQLSVIEAKIIPYRLPVCYSSDLERFILALWTRTHFSNTYKHQC